MELSVIVLASFFAFVDDGVFMFKAPNALILPDGLGNLVPMSNRLARRIDDLGFFQIICTMGFDPGLAHVAFNCKQVVN